MVSAALIGGLVFLPATHHATHHWRARRPWLKERKRWHALHHRRGEWPAYYGVTTSFWDHVFGSVQTTRGVGPTTDPSHRTTL